MKKIIILNFIILSFYSCGPNACDCIEIVDNKMPYFGNNGKEHALKTAECYEKFSDEKYKKFSNTEDWEKQLKHAERLQPIARAKMLMECSK